MVFPGSSGALCLTELETALKQKQGGEILVLSCKVIQRLQPLQHESNKEKVLLTTMFCYQLHLWSLHVWHTAKCWSRNVVIQWLLECCTLIKKVQVKAHGWDCCGVFWDQRLSFLEYLFPGTSINNVHKRTKSKTCWNVGDNLWCSGILSVGKSNTSHHYFRESDVSSSEKTSRM